MTAEDRLERAYHNLRPEYHLYIRRSDFRTLADMLRLADEYERARRHEKTYQPSSKQRSKDKIKPTAALITPGYKPQECCWGCSQREHTRRFCRRPAKLFCSQCGKEEVLTKNCHGTRSGNGSKAGGGGETSRPTTTADSTA